MNAGLAKQFAFDVVARLRAAGFEAYLAGGCVRDLLMGGSPSDYDVATDARPERVAGLFRRTCAVGESFGVVRVLGPTGAGDVEVATFRTDGEYRDGRRPESIRYATAEFDASRRDFTINGMFLDPADGRIIDFVGGRADLDARVLRAIGGPSARFAEDKLRLLRAVRFAARFGLTIDPATRAAVESMAAEVVAVAPERIAQELRKMLVDPRRSEAIRLAADTGLIAAILPALVPLRRLPGGTEGDDLWSHTLRVLDLLPEAPGFPLALAALLIDSGRPDKLGEGGADGPDRAGRAATLAVASGLKLANAERDRAAWLVEHHRALREPTGLRASRLKRILASEAIGDLLALHRADALASGRDDAHVTYCASYLRDEPDGPVDPPPLLNGHDLARHGLRPGPDFARFLEAVRDAQLDRTITSRDEALALVDRLRETPA